MPEEDNEDNVVGSHSVTTCRGLDDGDGWESDSLLYISGELSDRERMQFEELLAKGGEACDLLADLVILEQAVRANQLLNFTELADRNIIAAQSSSPAGGKSGTASVPRAGAQANWSESVRWRLALSGTAVAAVLWGLMIFRPAVPRLVDVAVDSGAEDLLIFADAWAQLRSIGGRSEMGWENDSLEFDWNERVLNDSTLIEGELSWEALALGAIPDWMFAAVDAERFLDTDQATPELLETMEIKEGGPL